jgi:hypothetical protein
LTARPIPSTAGPTTGGPTGGGDGDGGSGPGKTFWIILAVVTGVIILLIIAAAFIYVQVKKHRTKQYNQMQESGI